MSNQSSLTTAIEQNYTLYTNSNNDVLSCTCKVISDFTDTVNIILIFKINGEDVFSITDFNKSDEIQLEELVLLIMYYTFKDHLDLDMGLFREVLDELMYVEDYPELYFMIYNMHLYMYSDSTIGMQIPFYIPIDNEEAFYKECFKGLRMLYHSLIDIRNSIEYYDDEDAEE